MNFRASATQMYVGCVTVAAVLVILGWVDANIAMLLVLVIMFGVCCLPGRNGK